MKQQRLHSPRGAAAYHIRNVTVLPKETLDRQRDGYVQWCVVLFTPRHQPRDRLMVITIITGNPPLIKRILAWGSLYRSLVVRRRTSRKQV